MAAPSHEGRESQEGKEDQTFLSLLQECRISRVGISPDDAKKLVQDRNKRGGEWSESDDDDG